MDVFYLISQIDKLCRERKMPKAKFYEMAGITASAVSQWRNKKTVPAESTIQRIADVFCVDVDVLTGNKTKKAPTDGERDMTMDDFTYAMQNEAKDLTDMDKQILLSMAKQLNDARKKKDGESG